MLLVKLQVLLQLGQVFRNNQLLNNSKLLEKQVNIFNNHLNDILSSYPSDDNDQLIAILSSLKKDSNNLKGYSHSFPFWSSSSAQTNYIDNLLPLLIGSLNKLETYIIKATKATFDALLTIGKDFSSKVSKIFNEDKFSSYEEFQQQSDLLDESFKAMDIYLKKLLEIFPNNSENTDLIQLFNSAKLSFEDLQHLINHTYKEALNFHYYPKEIIAKRLSFFDKSLNDLKQKLYENSKNTVPVTYFPSHNG